MSVQVRFVTDPACPWSWAAEPHVRRLMVEFGETLRWTWVMGGLARSYEQGYGAAPAGSAAGSPYPSPVAEWLDAADRSRMPLDPRLWSEGPIHSTYPVCMAVEAAAEQGADAELRYLRAAREGLLCFRRKLDTTEALVDEARTAGLDVERFRRDLGSHAIVEAFGADLERARTVPVGTTPPSLVPAAGGAERLPFPSAAFVGEDGEEHWVFGFAGYDDYRAAAERAGARADGEALAIPAALRRFGRMAGPELEAVSGVPETLATAELWRLAAEWRVRPIRVLTGWLWEVA